MKIKNIIEVNPFFVYIIAFSTPFIFYPLDWSSLFPNLSFSLVFFFIITFIISFFFGLKCHKKKRLTFRHIENKLDIKKLIIFIYFGYILEFIYAKQIPLLSILRNQDIDYREFGIPTFHVVLTTFTSFLTVHIFTVYMSEKKRKLLLYIISLFVFPFLIFNRGMILLNLTSIFFVYLAVPKKSRLGMYGKILLILIVILFGFGSLGNIRTSNQIDKNGNFDVNTIMLNICEARPSFVNSVIPKEYFWTYIYVCSPLANLQQTVNYPIKGKNNNENFIYYVLSELNFDFVSKRIFKIIDYEPLWISQIAPFLTVGTIYGKSYSYLGWAGMMITFLFLMCITFIYLAKLSRRNPYFSTGLAILNCTILFSIFDNMIAFSGLGFQLIYPLILPKIFKV